MKLSSAMRGAVMLIGLGAAGPAPAQTPPADCSVGAIADGPLVLKTPGAPDIALPAAMVVSVGGMNDDDSKTVYDELQLRLNDRVPQDPFDHVAEVRTAFYVAAGKSLDGRMFRRPAAERGTPEYDAQDKVAGQVVFQSWSVKVPAPAGSADDYAIDVNHVASTASARVEFGKRSGKSLPGRIHLCVAAEPKDDSGDAPRGPIEVVGSFVVTVK